MIYLVATPVGNLSDITFRALETLKSVDYILCEDTRVSQQLLSHYAIKKPLVSYHKYSESSQQERILSDLKEGKKIALISDAGTPGIADPGAQLVAACRSEAIPVTPIPGACAAITALCASGLPTDLFQFIGFLPKKRGELQESLKMACLYPGTTIAYESPHRLLDTLALLKELSPNCLVVIARELTKVYEEFVQGTPAMILEHFATSPLKGEIVLMLQGGAPLPSTSEDLTPLEHVAKLIQTEGLSTKEAIATVAKQRGLNKRTLYKLFTLSS